MSVLIARSEWTLWQWGALGASILLWATAVILVYLGYAKQVPPPEAVVTVPQEVTWVNSIRLGSNSAEVGRSEFESAKERKLPMSVAVPGTFGKFLWYAWYDEARGVDQRYALIPLAELFVPTADSKYEVRCEVKRDTKTLAAYFEKGFGYWFQLLIIFILLFTNF